MLFHSDSPFQPELSALFPELEIANRTVTGRDYCIVSCNRVQLYQFSDDFTLSPTLKHIMKYLTHACHSFHLYPRVIVSFTSYFVSLKSLILRSVYDSNGQWVELIRKSSQSFVQLKVFDFDSRIIEEPSVVTENFPFLVALIVGPSDIMQLQLPAWVQAFSSLLRTFGNSLKSFQIETCDGHFNDEMQCIISALLCTVQTSKILSGSVI